MPRPFARRGPTSAVRHMSTLAFLGGRLFLAAALLLSGCAAQAADPPTPAANTAADQKSARDPRLDERDRYETAMKRLEREGKLAEAIEQGQAMLALEREIYGGKPHREIAASLEWLVRLYEQKGDFASARQCADEFVEMNDALYGRDGWRLAEAKRRRALVDRWEALDADERWRLFDARRQVDLLESEARYAESLEFARQSLAILIQRFGEEDYYTILTLRRVAELSLLAGEFETVERNLRECARALERAVGHEHPEVAATYDLLGGYFRAVGKHDEAASFYQQSLEILRTVYGPDHQQTGVGINNLAVAYDDLADYDRAVPLYRESLRIALLHHGESHDDVRITRDNLARVLATQGENALDGGDYATAERLLAEATELRSLLYGTKDWRTVDARTAAERANRLASMTENQRRRYTTAGEHFQAAVDLGSEGKTAEALAEAELALADYRAVFGDTDRTVPIALNETAVHLASLRKYDDALERYRQAERLFGQLLGEEHPEIATNLMNQGHLHYNQGQLDDAIGLYKQAVDLRAKVLGKSDADYAQALLELGQAYGERGDTTLAEPLLQEALDVARPMQVSEPALYVRALYDLSSHYRQRSDYSRSAPLLQEALQRAKDVFGEESAEVAQYLNELAALHDEQGRHTDAIPLYERSIELYTKLGGRESSDVATCLDNLGRLYFDDANYDRAEPLLAEALEIRRSVFGREHPAVHASLANLAALYRAQQRYDRAEPLLVESVELCRQVNGETSPVYASRLLELARLYDVTERAPRAAELRAASLAALEQGLADQDAERLQRRLSAFASTLDELAGEFYDREAFPAALRAYRLRLQANTKLFGPEHWKTIDARLELADREKRAALSADERRELATADELLNQASDAQNKGHYREALPLVERALEIRRRLLGNDNRYTVAALERLSTIHGELAQFAEASAELEEALRLRRQLVGERHPDVAGDMAALGILARQMGNFALAEEMYRAYHERCLELYGEISTETAQAMNNLAVLYEDMGRPAQALPFARRAVEVFTQLLGEDHLDTLNATFTLAAVYLRMEDVERATPLFARVMYRYKDLLGPDHPDYIESVHTVATICADNNVYEMAEQFFREALEGREKTVGKDHPDYARTLNGLALLHWNQDKVEQAIAEHEQVLDIRLRRLGPRHTLTAQTQSNLARAYLELGRYDEAEKLLQAALETRRAVLDPASPHIGSTLYGLALLYLATDRRDEARAALEESIALDQHQLEGVAAFASEPSLRDFLRSIGYKYDRLMALAAAHPEDQATARAALTWTLRRKSVILDTLCEYRAAESIFRHDPHIASQLDEVKQLRQQATNLALAPPAGMTMEHVTKEQQKLRNRARDIEEGIREELNRRRLHEQKPEISPESVAASLPAGSALVEYVRFPTYDFKSWDENRDLGDHYGAFVLVPGATEARFIELGPADTIDAAVSAVRHKIDEAPRELRLSSEAELEADYLVSGRRLAELILDPLRRALGKATSLFIAPDRELNRVPFAALVADGGQYLLENYDLAYLSCGRDLLRSFPKSGEGTLVFAGPDYDLASPARAVKAEEMLANSDDRFEIQLADRSAPVDVDLRALRWNRLPGAEGEAVDVSDALSGSEYAPVSLFVGANALEDVFKAAHSPRILHIATHGFFLTAAEQGPDSIERGPGESAEAGAGAAGGIARLRLNANPLLRSGIVLAGANDLATDAAAATKVEDGWVTAEEISLLDFRGTELVVLSACESGLGDIDTRDGVYGLRRAFFHAGAHNLLTSLFKVPDAETRRLMAAFYGTLATGQTKLAALHAAQRKILAERRSAGKAAHPFFWASFILVGEGI